MWWSSQGLHWQYSRPPIYLFHINLHLYYYLLELCFSALLRADHKHLTIGFLLYWYIGVLQLSQHDLSLYILTPLCQMEEPPCYLAPGMASCIICSFPSKQPFQKDRKRGGGILHFQSRLIASFDCKEWMKKKNFQSSAFLTFKFKTFSRKKRGFFLAHFFSANSWSPPTPANFRSCTFAPLLSSHSWPNRHASSASHTHTHTHTHKPK